MNSLNKMLHEKPTREEREAMTKISKNIEYCKFKLRLLHEQNDKANANLRRLKQQEVKLLEDNEERSTF